MRRCNRTFPSRMAIAAVALVAAACVTRTESVSVVDANPGVAPALVVERFLNAANASDLETMGRLFGTRDGPVIERDPRPEVEKRMFALASILRHQNYVLESEMDVPGRSGQAVRITVLLHIGSRRVPVPFTVVRTKQARWVVEQIEIEAITSGA